MSFLQRLFGKHHLALQGSQVPLLDLEASNVPMRRVYLLSEELRREPRRVELAQALTGDRERPRMGLRGSRGLFASPEWWDSINVGKMPLRRLTGVIVRLYEAGQDQTGVINSFDLRLNDGSIQMESIYVNERSEKRLFEAGSLVQVLYALDELKRCDDNGAPEIADIVLEMAVSTKPMPGLGRCAA